MLNDKELAEIARNSAPAKAGLAGAERVYYWRAKCDACSWSGGDMLFRSEAEQEAAKHNDYAHASTGDTAP